MDCSDFDFDDDRNETDTPKLQLFRKRCQLDINHFRLILLISAFSASFFFICFEDSGLVFVEYSKEKKTKHLKKKMH